MYKIKWYQENGIYEACGGASANSLFFETQSDHELFLRMWNQFMGDISTIVHYSFTEVSWSIIFKTDTEEVIKSLYKAKRKLSKKVKKPAMHKSVGPIISENIRLFLSSYVICSNRQLGKDGSRVKRRFEKYGFINTDDYKERITLLERMEKLYEQNKVKYRPNESHYDEIQEMRFVDIFRSAKPYYIGDLGGHYCLNRFEIIEDSSKVLRSKIQETYIRHFNRHKPPNPPHYQE